MLGSRRRLDCYCADTQNESVLEPKRLRATVMSIRTNPKRRVLIRSRLDLSRASVLGKAHGEYGETSRAWASKSSLDLYRYYVGAEWQLGQDLSLSPGAGGWSPPHQSGGSQGGSSQARRAQGSGGGTKTRRAYEDGLKQLNISSGQPRYTAKWTPPAAAPHRRP